MGASPSGLRPGQASCSAAECSPPARSGRDQRHSTATHPVDIRTAQDIGCIYSLWVPGLRPARCDDVEADLDAHLQKPCRLGGERAQADQLVEMAGPHHELTHVRRPVPPGDVRDHYPVTCVRVARPRRGRGSRPSSPAGSAGVGLLPHQKDSSRVALPLDLHPGEVSPRPVAWRAVPDRDRGHKESDYLASLHGRPLSPCLRGVQKVLGGHRTGILRGLDLCQALIDVHQPRPGNGPGQRAIGDKVGQLLAAELE